MASHRFPRGIIVLALAAVVAAGCATRQPAPVVERTPAPVPAPPAAKPEPPRPPAPAGKPIATHTVKRGDTLVGISLQYGLDYRELAAWNGITNPNVITVGQVLLLSAPGSAATGAYQAAPSPAATSALATGTVAMPLAGPEPVVEARPLANTDRLKVEPRAQRLPYSEKALAQLSSAPPVLASSGTPAATAASPAPGATGAPTGAAAVPPTVPPVATAAPAPAPSAEPDRPAAGTQGESVDWNWPVKGKIIAGFTEANKGIDISGKKGTAIAAAASGRVVYAGQGLRGYGKLVIIKHSETWLSAYAHNDNILVKEQQEVKRGQKIAEMGSTDADQVKLHFEVRRQGKPVDPVKVLPPS
jgi:lipoprotein NlpD